MARDEHDAWEPPPQAMSLRRFVTLSDAEAEAARVTCETCPVNMSCMAGQGGTGYVVACCDATSMCLQEKPKRVLIIDCAKHRFERTTDTKSIKKCGLCSAGVLQIDARNLEAQYYLPTVHAKVPVTERLAFFKAELPVVQEKVRMLQEEEAKAVETSRARKKK